MPIYLKRMTDVSACAQYGKGLLVEVYGKWRKFQERSSSSYGNVARRILSAIEDRLVSPRSSCGSLTDIVQELELFIETYPNSELSSKVKLRIEEIKNK